MAFTLLKQLGTSKGRIPIFAAPITIIILSWLNYFSLYFLRKSQTVTKLSYTHHLGISKRELGYLDNAYLIPYALGQTFLSSFVDRAGSRIGWGVTLVPSAVCMVLVFFVYNKWSLAFLLAVNGFFQAMCWPSTVKQMTNYMSGDHFKLILPIWSSCVFVGNWVGNRLGGTILKWAELDTNCVIENTNSANITLSQNQITFLHTNITSGQWGQSYPNTTIPIIECSDNNAWKKVFYLPAFITLSWGVLSFMLTYDDTPSNYKKITTIHTIEKEESEEFEVKKLDNGEKSENSESVEKESETSEPITLINVLKTIPTAWFLAFGYFAVKGARYWMYYWANTFMVKSTNETITESMAANIMEWFDIGAFSSSLVLGPMLMKYKLCGKSMRMRPAFLCAIVCGLTIPATIWFSKSMSSENFERDDIPVVKVIMLIIGFLLAVPDSLFSGICAADIAKYDGRAVQATLGGFINGFGGWGPFIGSPITGEIWARYGSCEKDDAGVLIDGKCEEDIGVIIYVIYVFMVIGVVASFVADVMLKRQRTRFEAKHAKKGVL